MCRNIKTLHNFKPPATDEEIRASSVQFVRKLSGFPGPPGPSSMRSSRMRRLAIARSKRRKPARSRGSASALEIRDKPADPRRGDKRS